MNPQVSFLHTDFIEGQVKFLLYPSYGYMTRTLYTRGFISVLRIYDTGTIYVYGYGFVVVCGQVEDSSEILG